MCYHRAVLAGDDIKHAVIKQVRDHWYAVLMLDLPNPEPKPWLTGHQVGVDVGLKDLAALSNGELIENPGWLQENLAQLRHLQQYVSQQAKGSDRRKEIYRQITHLHECIANQRADALHKISNRVIENDLIVIENLCRGFIGLRGGNHSALAGGGSRAPLLE